MFCPWDFGALVSSIASVLSLFFVCVLKRAATLMVHHVCVVTVRGKCERVNQKATPLIEACTGEGNANRYRKVHTSETKSRGWDGSLSCE